MSKSFLELFKTDGYVVVPGLFQEELLCELREALERVIMKVNENPEEYQTRYTDKGETSWDTWGVYNIFDLPLYEKPFGKVFDNASLMELVKEILGDELRFWGAHALWSPRKVDYELNWHRDNGWSDSDVVEGGEATHVQFNICLLDDHSFKVIPGSHLRPLNDLEKQQEETKGHASLPYERTAKANAGDVLFMNSLTFHRGSCSSETLRRTLHMNLQPAKETVGGRGTWRFMRSKNYLEEMTPTVKTLMLNAIDWDDKHPPTMAEARSLMRQGRVNRDFMANSLNESK